MDIEPDQPSPGEAATATIVVRNEGRGPADGVVVIDEVSPGATVRSALDGAGACEVSTRQADCRLGRLAPGNAAAAEVRLLLDRVPPQRTVEQRIRLATSDETLVTEQAVSTLIEPTDPPKAIGPPGMPVTLVTVFSLALAARSTRVRGGQG